MPPPLAPDPTLLHPVSEHPRIMFVRNLPGLVNVEIGEYTYYDDPAGPEAFARNILYHFAFEGDRLRIGRFTAIATGVRFIMNGANHRMDGLTTYPFPIFPSWRNSFDGEMDFPSRGDTVIGHDVWLGYDSLLLPGITIGDGAVVGARAVVTKNVPPYTIVAGNPARIIRQRFSDQTIQRLLALAWWNWPIDKITRAIPLLSAGNEASIAQLEHL
jgi:virginiamycin A acetyltransferase